MQILENKKWRYVWWDHKQADLKEQEKQKQLKDIQKQKAQITSAVIEQQYTYFIRLPTPDRAKSIMYWYSWHEIA